MTYKNEIKRPQIKKPTRDREKRNSLVIEKSKMLKKCLDEFKRKPDPYYGVSKSEESIDIYKELEKVFMEDRQVQKSNSNFYPTLQSIEFLNKSEMNITLSNLEIVNKSLLPDIEELKTELNNSVNIDNTNAEQRILSEVDFSGLYP
jgi:hypothetical protein